MPQHGTVAIVGAGLAGFQTAASLREFGFDGRVVLLGDEPYRPYQRPPLSKTYLLGATEEARLPMRPEAFYRDRKIELMLGRRAVAIDRAHRKLALDDDSVIAYEHLVLAVGARNRPLPVPGGLQSAWRLERSCQGDRPPHDTIQLSPTCVKTSVRPSPSKSPNNKLLIVSVLALRKRHSALPPGE